MPRLIDYGVRFELTREAVIAVTLREGAAAVNLQTVSRELGVSVATVRRFLASAGALPQLGLEHIERQRRNRRMNGGGVSLLTNPSAQRLMAAVRLELPLTEQRLEEARVWDALVTAYPGPVIDKFEERERRVRGHLFGALLHRLELPEEQRPLELLRLTAVMTGLTTQLVTGEITAEAAEEVIDHHLLDLAAHPADGVA